MIPTPEAWEADPNRYDPNANDAEGVMRNLAALRAARAAPRERLRGLTGIDPGADDADE